MSIANSIRKFALGPRSQPMSGLPYCLIESFETFHDWHTSSLWSVQWRTFALLVAEALDDESERADRYREALTWALGSNGDFRSRELGEGAYWWRKELQARAGLEWTGSEFVDGDMRWLTNGVGVVQPWEVKVHCSKGERTLRAGMQWRDGLYGGTWEVVEPKGGRIYSPSGFGGTPTFWCKPVGEVPEGAKRWLEQAREDGCVGFCGDSIAASLIEPLGVEVDRPVKFTFGTTDCAMTIEQAARELRYFYDKYGMPGADGVKGLDRG